MKNKQYYLNKYYKLYDKEDKRHLKEFGYHCEDVKKYLEKADEIVGYYIYVFDDKALESWKTNLEHFENQTDKHKEITKILESLYKK